MEGGATENGYLLRMGEESETPTHVSTRLAFFFDAMTEFDRLLALDADRGVVSERAITGLVQRLGARSCCLLRYAAGTFSCDSLAPCDTAASSRFAHDERFSLLATSASGPLQVPDGLAADLGQPHVLWAPLRSGRVFLGGLLFLFDGPVELDRYAEAYVSGAADALARALRNDQLFEMLMSSMRSFEEKDRKIRQAYVEIFSVVTGGRLVLATDDEVTGVLGRRLIPPQRLSEPRDVSQGRSLIRRVLGEVMPGCHYDDDFALAFTEAMVNAEKHGTNATYSVHITQDDRIQVLVQDDGSGIDFSRLPRATLESGYSTAQTMGLGFTLMLTCSSRVLLATDEGGTRVLLESELLRCDAGDAAAVSREPAPLTR